MGAGMSGQWEFWIDRGGTFTDVVARAPDGSSALGSCFPKIQNDIKMLRFRASAKRSGSGRAVARPGSVRAVKMGTTVATNALLERKGERVLLLITEGFGDLLRIGYQNRPRLFDLEIKRPDLLYEEVAEIHERLDADGEI